MDALLSEIGACRICAGQFAQTATTHVPRPVVWMSSTARVLIAGQAPGARVHESRRPFTDPSGDRLRSWLGIDEVQFYDTSRIALVPMAFCFPGYDAKGSDLPPPQVCASTWHARVMSEMTGIRLRILLGAHALKWHLNWRGSLRDAVLDWRSRDSDTFVLPHPSWRNTALLKRHPEIETEILPRLRRRLYEVLDD